MCQHAGEFFCERIHDKKNTKVVNFAHVTTAPSDCSQIPAFGRLRDFYGTFGSVLFYFDENSGDAAKYLAPTSKWLELHGDFNDWIEDLDEAEREEILPDWIATCIVIGETPQSGNYILMVTEGSETGKVIEFDHDGFEFDEMAKDIVEYVEKLLKPSGSRLTDIASHMRFIEGDPMIQWWIREMKDNHGHWATTAA